MKLLVHSKQTRGQTMMEYIILVALLAVASIPVIKVLGDSFRANVLQSADALVDGTLYDDDASTQIQNAQSKVRRSLSNFHHVRRGGGDQE